MKDNTNISDLILLKFLKGEAEGEELRAVASWLASNEDHVRELEDLKKVWQSTGALADFEAIDLSKNWDVVQHKLTRQSGGFSVGNWWRYAAAVLLVSVAAFLILRKPDVPGLMTYTATVPEELVLEDGSSIWLNAGATLEYPEHFTENSREVRLSGEAFFDVTHNPARPFKVLADGTVTEVLGTTFNIKEEPGEQFSLTLLTGKIAFTKASVREELLPGQQIIIDADGTFSKSLTDDPNVLAWKTRKLSFDNMPMRKLIEDVEKLYDVEISLQNPSFGDCPITTTFQDESLEEVLETIKLLFDIEIKKNGQRYQLIGKGC